MIKIDTDGNILTTKQFGTINNDIINNIAIDKNDDVLLNGKTSGALDGNIHLGGTDIFLIKVPN